MVEDIHVDEDWEFVLHVDCQQNIHSHNFSLQIAMQKIATLIKTVKNWKKLQNFRRSIGPRRAIFNHN